MLNTSSKVTLKFNLGQQKYGTESHRSNCKRYIVAMDDKHLFHNDNYSFFLKKINPIAGSTLNSMQMQKYITISPR